MNRLILGLRVVQPLGKPLMVHQCDSIHNILDILYAQEFKNNVDLMITWMEKL